MACPRWLASICFLRLVYSPDQATPATLAAVHAAGGGVLLVVVRLAHQLAAAALLGERCCCGMGRHG